MKNSSVIRVEGRQDTPTIVIDETKQLVKISGSSFNESAIDLYYQILDWVHKIEKNLEGQLHFEFDYIYINSSTKKMVFVLLNHLEKLFKAGNDILITWYYEEYDDDMLELGEDFAELITMPFNFIPKEEEDYY
ncbi:MAG: hypothetical protein CSA05_02735 [Bacteroidia bacterium]|nr:MAG: hypothetical protein CSA05_02735 [Bacteroidia bacterium]